MFDIAAELKDFGIEVQLTDPKADPLQVEKEYGCQLSDNPLASKNKAVFDAIVLAVAHKEYLGIY